MKTLRIPLTYESPLDSDILEAYINKNGSYNRTAARRIKRALRKLVYI